VSASEGADAPGGLASAWRTITLIVMGLLGVAVAVALIVTLGQANSQRENAQRLQSHSYDVTVLARTLSATIARSEASLGRFVISGDKQLGQLYYDDWRRAGDQIDQLERLTADSPEQQRRIERLRRAYQVRGEELSLTALSTNYGKNQQALSRYYQARKAPALVEMDALLDRIIRGERTLLRQRTEAAMATVAQAGRAARVLSVFGAGLVLGAIALGWLTVRALGERAVARADAEAERRRAEELAVAVAEATETLRAQEVQLRQVQKMEAVGQLTGGIAHDFNNMLAVVIGGIELARRGLLTGADVSRHLDSASEGAQRAAALTRQLLAFARERSSDPEPVAVGALVAGMRDLLDRTLGDAIRVEVSDASDGTHVRADRVQFENTILNLAVNARDAMEGRGTLAIALGIATLTASRGACAPGDYLRLAVADTGCGMSPEVVERAFEPFFTTKPVGKGTGLGLSQIFAFARQAGGDVEIASVPGSGTRVTLLLPRCQPAATASPAIEPQFLASASGSLRILVVEDDPRVLRATVGALEELGHIPLPCADPLAAPAMLAGAAVDLIISDVLMPGRTGPEMIAALAPEHAALPVLFVTGFAGDAAAGPDLGGRSVLRKPFTLVALERAVAEAAGGRPPEQISAE
jgi:signal transduction histidine kinase